MAGSGLKVFFDSFSQPSRAVLLLLHVNKVPYEPMLLKLAKGACQGSYEEMREGSSPLPKPGAHYVLILFFAGDTITREDLKEANPNRQVPTINDNGFCLAERSPHFCIINC